jgi:tetratricopeptide (TPR) repeat protein/transcriptional regulator with XRE-family HTH domain
MTMAREWTFGERLRRERKLHHWNQAELAKEGEFSEASIQRWERDHGLPNPTSQKTLCKLFGKDVEHWGILPTKDTIWNVPFPRNQFFTGREDILTKLYTSLSGSNSISYTQPHALTGLGGSGKTQVVLEYAYRHRNEYEAVLWVGADSFESLVSNYAALATTLDLPTKNETNQNYMIKAVKQWLNIHPSWLLIFDNVNSPDNLATFLPEDGKGSILVTTRTQILGELIKRRFKLGKMKQGEAIHLLLHRSRLIDEEGKNTVSEAEWQSAVSLYVLLDGLPLALAQAAAYIEETEITLADYLNLFQKYPNQLLSRGKLSGYKYTVATTWAVSFQHIEEEDPSAADLLRACAFLHPDAIPLKMLQEGSVELNTNLQSILNDQLSFKQCIEILRRYSLVQQSSTETLVVHRLVQTTVLSALSNDMRKAWEIQMIQAINKALPDTRIENWPIYEQYLQHIQYCADISEKDGTIILELASLLNRIGDYLQERGRYSEAETPLQKALKIRENLIGLHHPDTATSLHSLALLYYVAGRYNEVEQFYQRGLTIREQSLGYEHPDTLSIQNDLSLLYWKLGNYEKAESLLKRTLEAREMKLGRVHLDTAESMNSLALLYAEQQKYIEAEKYSKQVLTIIQKLMGFEHPLTATSLNNLAMLYYEQRKYKDAEPLLQRALSIREQRLGAEHPYTAGSLNNLARIYFAEGRYEEAEEFFRKALSIREQKLGVEHPDTAITLYHFAQFLHEQQRYTEAEQFYHRSIEIRKRILGPKHPDTTAVEKDQTRLLQRIRQETSSPNMNNSSVPPKRSAKPS